MSNNLRVLEALKQSAKDKKEELENFIKEIHKQSLEQLSSDLTAITIKKLNTIEKNINSKMEEIEEQNKWRYSLKHLLTAIGVSALIFLLVGIVIADYTPRNHEKLKWIVPKQMRYQQGSERYIQSEAPIIGRDKKTYIKIGEE